MAAEIYDEEVIERFLNFEKRSTAHFKDFFDRIKEDRRFLSGEHFDETDDEILGNKRYKAPVDVISNQIRSIANQYSANPYQWLTKDGQLDFIGSEFLNTTSSKASIMEALKSTVAFGLSYIVISTDYDLNNQVEPILYNIPDVTKVLYDPDSVELDGKDARKAAIIDIKSKDWIANTYGPEYVSDKNEKPLVNISESYDEDSMPLITFFEKTEQGISIYKLLNNSVIEYSVLENVQRLPIIPIYGDSYYLNDKITYKGIVRQARPIQKIIDITYCQLIERMAKSPKNMFLASKDAVEGLENYYKNSDKNRNQLLLYNTGKTAPQKMDNTYATGDIMTVLSNCIGMMQNLTGVQSIGLPEIADSRTATEVMLADKSFINNIRHYFEHLKASFRAAGEVFYGMLGFKVSVNVIKGPESEMQRQIARQQMANLVNITPDDKKLMLIKNINSTFEDNEYIQKFNQELMNGPSPEVIKLQQQMAMMQQQMQQQIDQANQANIELSKELEQANLQLLGFEQSNKNNLIMAQLKAETDLRKEVLKIESDAVKEDKKAQIDLAKESMKQEQENIRLAAELQADNQKEMINIITDEQ
jgi:hypothetical protein